MPISKDLFLAILSMDAYNRGHGAGINNEGINDTDGLGTIGSKLGRATVRDESDVDDGTPSVEAGFYALVEGIAAGDTVIACRGGRGRAHRLCAPAVPNAVRAGAPQAWSRAGKPGARRSVPVSSSSSLTIMVDQASPP